MLYNPCKNQTYYHNLDFPDGPDSKSICLQGGRPRFDPWVGKIPWRRKWQPTPVFLPGESHGRRSQVDYSPWGHKHIKITGLARRFNPETVLREDTLLFYNPKEYRGKKVCPFFLLENSRPLSSWGPLDFL